MSVGILFDRLCFVIILRSSTTYGLSLISMAGNVTNTILVATCTIHAIKLQTCTHVINLKLSCVYCVSLTLTQCYSFQHNTTGPRCELCLPGHYGNPSLGRRTPVFIAEFFYLTYFFVV